MAQRKAKLVPFKDFEMAFQNRQKEIAALESHKLEDPRLDTARTADALWDIIATLHISDNHAKLVSSTKALHHLLPDLIVPMDRAFTGAFFGWSNHEWQVIQERSFKHAIVGFCRSHHLDQSSLSELGKSAQAMGLSVDRAPAAQPTAAAILNALVEKREDIKHFGVRSLGLFGSAARGEAAPTSDLDFLVEFESPSFDTYMGLLEYLEKLFGHRVDLVLANTLKPRLRESVLREIVHVQGL
jgi:hypothetical protein